MAAGLGFKTFTTGEVLSAGDTNGYLMQGVLVFASAAARDAAITSPQEGQYAFLKDTDSLTYYTGSAWASASASASVNLLLNSNFALNQRSYVSAATLTSGTYGFDRWKSNFATTTLTFTASTQGQSLTISASGGLQQVIEQGLVPAGTYTLSWTGTATGRVYNSGGTPPSYAASPVTFTADGTANVVVEFTASAATKTVSKVQFNAGTDTTWRLATPTLATELSACQRYYFRTPTGLAYQSYGVGIGSSTTVVFGQVFLPVQMRTAPTVLDYANLAVYDTSAPVTVTSAALGAGIASTANVLQVALTTTSATLTAFRPYQITNANSTSAYIGVGAEL